MADWLPAAVVSTIGFCGSVVVAAIAARSSKAQTFVAHEIGELEMLHRLVDQLQEERDHDRDEFRRCQEALHALQRQVQDHLTECAMHATRQQREGEQQ